MALPVANEIVCHQGMVSDKDVRAVNTLLGICFKVVNLDGLPTPEVGSLAAIWARGLPWYGC